MANTIGFSTVKAYLDGIARLNGLVASSPHRAFWRIDYDAFISGDIPGGARVNVNGRPTPIINKEAPDQSAFYLILVTPQGWEDKEQMPMRGPYITDDNLQVPLADGNVVTGKQIRDDLANWLRNGYPKEPSAATV